MLPLGLLYAASIIERAGHRAKILDPHIDDLELTVMDSGDFSGIFKAIDDFKPSVIGYGGIATSFGRTKKISLAVKERFNSIIQIAGGPLASVSGLLLNKTAIGVVFHGETEASLPVFLDKIAYGKLLEGVPGISYRNGDKVLKNQDAEQVAYLDTIPFPAYHLVDLKRYFDSTTDLFKAYSGMIAENPLYAEIKERVGEGRSYVSIVTARGCTHRCSFCYRHMRGIRQHSTDYVIRHMKYLKDMYGVDGFLIADELFNSKPEWVREFCDALEREKLEVFYTIAGARVDRVNASLLRRLKETGCIKIEYGQESGSDRILSEYRKGITRRQNKEVTLLTTRDIGLFSVVQIVIGSPSETHATILETIEFLKEIGAHYYSLNYLMPLPGTPVWGRVEDSGLIKDVEKYLDMVAEYGGQPIVNLTSAHDNEWRRWADLIRKETRLDHYSRRNSKYYPLYALIQNVRSAIAPYLPMGVKRMLSKLVRT